MPTATLTLTSADIAGDPVNVSKTSTCYKAGTTTVLDQTGGLNNVILTSGSANTILAFNAAGTNKAAKVYIKNNSTVSTEYITVTTHATIVGKLYAGQWLFMPWSMCDSDSVIKVTASGAGLSLPIEYMLMHEGWTFA